MSTNVSLNNAGTSLNFDGQALQSQQEAEMDREEELQQKELRQLLSNAFDDLDDDILSVASSDDDSVNTSHMSTHHDVSSQHGSSLPMERTANSVGGGPSSITSALAVVVTSAALTTPYPSHPTPPPSHLHPHSLRASQEGSLGGMSHNSPVPHPDRLLPWRQMYEGGAWGGENGGHVTDDVWGGGKGGGGGGQTGVGVVREEPQHDVVDGLQLSSSLPYVTTTSVYPYTMTYTSTTTSTAAAGLSSFPYSQDQFPAQYWSHQPPGGYLPPSSLTGLLPFSSGGGGLTTQHPHDSADVFSTAQGWSTQVKDTVSGSFPDHLPFSPSGTTQSTSVGTYPHYVSHQYSDAGWNRTVGSHSHQGMDSVPAAYPAYTATPGSSQAGWEGGDQGGGALNRVGGRQGGTGLGEEGEDYDQYKVSYKKRQPSTHPTTSNASDLKVNFITQEGDNEDSSRQSQLLMLYQARGRELEDLRTQMDTLTHDSAKERRRLKHLLSVATGEKEGMETSLQQCQQLLCEVREEQSQTTAQLQTAQTQLKAATHSKEEVVKQLQNAETTIESLSHQVAGLQGTDSLTQARHQHEAVVSSLQQRFDAQILDLKQQVDMANNNLAVKGEEVERLQAQVREQTRRAEEAQISRGDTINQLTRSLEESQQRCQALLNASSGEESSKLRAQLQQSLVAKKMADDMCSSLQGEVQELKEQLHLLESATSLGALSATPHSDGLLNDTITDLGIRKTLDFSTPDASTRFDSSQSSEELVGKLRRELERCVVSNRQKRQQVGDLQQQTKRLTHDMDLLRQQLNDAQHTVQTQQVKLTSYEDRLGGSLQPSAVESRLKRDLDTLQCDNKALLKDLEDYKARLNEVSTNEEQLTQMNEQLKQQMAAMVTQHDLDMRQAIDRCRQSSEDSHQLSRQKLEHQLRSELFADKQELVMKYEGQLANTRAELQTIQEELDKVKELYVQAGCDLTRREEELDSKDQQLQDTIDAEKRKWESEHEVAMETVWQQRLQKARSDWETERQSERQNDWQQRLETERQKWESENQQHAEDTWQQRLESERTQWETQKEADLETTLKQRLDAARQEWESQKHSDMEKHWEQRLEQERQKWESQKTSTLSSELEQQLEKQRKSWESEKAAIEAEWKERLEKEQRSWQVRADREALEQSDIAVATARRQWQQETQQQLKLLTSQLDDCRSQHQAELVAMETKWRQEVEEKEGRMERHVQETLDREVGEKLRQQQATLTEKAQQTLQQELAKAEQHHQEELTRRVREEGERVSAEARRQMDAEKAAAVEAARSQWQDQLSHQQRDVDTHMQDASRWKAEAQRVQTELKQREERWAADRSQLLADKDEERRQAVSNVRSECQADYQRLMDESRSKLDSALDSARQHHQCQLEEIEARYKEELSALRTVEQELRQALSLTSTDPDQPASITAHTATLKKEGERWRKEGERLRREVEKRDKLLQQADQHMEQQVQRLKDSLADNYQRQREKDTLRLQAQYSQAMHINQKERTRLERQLELLQERLQQGESRMDTEREEELRSAREERDRLMGEVERLQEQKQQLDSALKEEEESRELQQQQHEDALRELQQQMSSLTEERDQLSQQLRESQRAVQAVREDREVQTAQLQEHNASLQQRVEQARGRAHQLDQALKAVTLQHKADTDRLNHSHHQKTTALNARLTQMQSQHAATLSELREQHKAERACLVEDLEARHRAEQQALEESLERKHQRNTHCIMEEVQRQARRALANTPTQTDSDDGLYHTKDQYLQTVQNIKAEVMSHISLSNERAAMAMKAEIRRERQRTIQHLRGRCKTRLHHLLQGQLDRLQNPDTWSLIDQALDSLFDSVSSSRSATPTTSNPITPRSSEDDSAHIPHPTDMDTPLRGGRGGGNVSNNSVYGSTPQSTGSERYDLPPALSMAEIQHQRSHGSLEDLQATGVFYSLVADDTASVTDSELEFKVPLAVRKSGSRRSAVQLGKTSSASDLHQRRSTPPKGNTNLSVFVSKDASPPSHSPALRSPKLHRGEGKERVGWKTGEGEESGWKEVDGEGWMAAVGSSKLWQAFSNLQSLDSEEKEPRRQLRFSAQSLMDNSSAATTDDSDASFANSADHLPQHDSDSSSTGHYAAKAAHKRRKSALSRSEDFTLREESLSLRRSGAGRNSAQAAERTPSKKPQLQFSDQSPQAARSHGSRSSLGSSHPDLVVKDWEQTPTGKKKTRTLPSRPAHVHSTLSQHASSAHPSQHAPLNHPASSKLLNPKDFLSQSGKKTSPGGGRETAVKSSSAMTGEVQGASKQGKKLFNPEQEGVGWENGGEEAERVTSAEHPEGRTGLETLRSMLERLGISAAPSHPHHSHSPKKNASSGRERTIDTAVPSSSILTKASTEKGKHPDKAKTRTRSADHVLAHPASGSQSRSPAKLSVFSAPQSSQIPVHRSRHHREGDLLQRSLENLHQQDQPSLAHESRVRWRSEQALHVLGEAFGEREGVGEEYSYTPLKHLLPPPSPSTSLMSTYSVSEGDLRHLPQHLAFDGNRF